jgi:hypothetical protein
VGSIKIDLNKKERDFKQLNLSDPNVIKWMILFRDKVDMYYDSRIDTFYNNAGEVKELNQELINTYTYLDELIDKCSFTEDQLGFIRLLSIGYTFKDIEQVTQETTSQNLKRRFEKICNKISFMNNKLWSIWINNNLKLHNTRICSICSNNLPLTQKFFSPDKSKSQGFKHICKNCR